jgi:hypothetical protein
MDVLGVIALPDARLSLHEPFDQRSDRVPYRVPHQHLIVPRRAELNGGLRPDDGDRRRRHDMSRAQR